MPVPMTKTATLFLAALALPLFTAPVGAWAADGCDLRRQPLYCPYADLRGIELVATPNGFSNWSRKFPVLRQANLMLAKLNGNYLSGADLSGAMLAGADLSGANLSGANLSGANLTRALLTNADLRGANLSGVDLSVTDLSGAKWTDGTTCKQPSHGTCVK